MFNRCTLSSVAAMCLAILVGCNTSPEGGSITGGPETASLPAESNVTNVFYSSGETITIKVPEMHCPFYCYPTVKETLTELGGIENIDLVSQKEEDKIDDPRIIIKLSEDFDWTNATKALEEAGFRGATVVAKD
ncbi:MAG: heavy-metal-associated domain-containing protein [Planctomycetaceae bacterium]|nr:heavy-metal-associated domain-containing protein [Planctomycetaceae bacterium]